jgi:hypothetical protein
MDNEQESESEATRLRAEYTAGTDAMKASPLGDRHRETPSAFEATQFATDQNYQASTDDK